MGDPTNKLIWARGAQFWARVRAYGCTRSEILAMIAYLRRIGIRRQKINARGEKAYPLVCRPIPSKENGGDRWGQNDRHTDFYVKD
jgi:hypothetical protein